MKLIGVLVLCLVCGSHSSWVDDLKSSKGLKLWDGFTVQLEDSMELTASPLQRYSLKVNYSGLGLTVQKDPKKEALQVGVHLQEQAEGRGKDKKMMEILIPTLLGFKATTVGAIVYTAMSAFVLKAVGVASLALFLSLTLLVSKLFSHPAYVQPKHIEIEAHASEQHPIYEYPPSEHGAFIPSEEASNYLAYGNYASGHETLAESQANFAVVDAPLNNGSNLSGGHATLIKRRDQARRQKQTTTPLLAVKKFTITT